jgi:hypothetical protein
MTVVQSRPSAYNKVLVTWKHGFQHTFVSVGNTLTGQLKALEGLEYVKEIMHYPITVDEYTEFGRVTGGAVEDTVEEVSEVLVEAPVVKKGGLQFSTLENFFGGTSAEGENTVEQKSPGRKSRKK